MRLFVWKGILKNTPLSSKIHCYIKGRNGLYLHRYRRNCKSVTFLPRPSPKLARKQGKVYRSSKHKRRGYLGGVRYQNVVLSKYLSLCTCNYPFYSTYKSLIHRVNFGQLKLSTDIEKNPAPSVYVDATKTIHAPYCQRNVVVFGENAGQQCVSFLARQSMFMLTELPEMRTAFERFF